MRTEILILVFSICYCWGGHFTNISWVTYGGTNAEAYWSPNGEWLTLQAIYPPYECDQIYIVSPYDNNEPILTSTGLGRTTCSYWTNDNKHVIYSSTHETMGPFCPPPPDASKGYVWPLYDYEIYQVEIATGDLKRLTNSESYDAESTVCKVDGSIIFTSTRDGDLELYRMNADGSNVTRLTFIPGYDGGAYFNDDCTKIVWRASRPTGDSLQEYYNLLKQNLVSPLHLEIFIANADGSNMTQVTNLGVASFAPYYFPDSERIIFSSDYNSTNFSFNLWAINTDGKELEQITYGDIFDSFPMFSPDGTKLAFCSTRNASQPHEINVLIADWSN